VGVGGTGVFSFTIVRTARDSGDEEREDPDLAVADRRRAKASEISPTPSVCVGSFPPKNLIGVVELSAAPFFIVSLPLAMPNFEMNLS
jgi:hypothetical protein